MATYCRNDLLARTLESLTQIELPDVQVELRLVDNDAQGSAFNVVNQYAKDLPFDVRYEIEPTRNIALARNRAIEMGPADLIAFIDDDEIADTDWLTQLVDAIDQTKADAVFGPVAAIMEQTHTATSNATDSASSHFTKSVPANNAPLDWTQTRTSNTLVVGQWFYDKGYRFDPRYGRSGGSDTEFFAAIAEQGATFAAASNAWVREYIGSDRMQFTWMMRRRFRGGIVYHRITQTHGGPHPLFVGFKRTVRSALLTLTGLLQLPFYKKDRLVEGALVMSVLAGGLYAWLLPELGDSFVEYHDKTNKTNAHKGTS